ncbi:DUF4132 domain-containing protein [Clostridium aciditolerans]|uniref:DUF4132 domain-containing protein n=1 Tax=Clostridium aciditolerans TaxID=339861 RepID=A0A934I1X2_9CLOT|nr:DUF4132 domain-containing protein [Clostridium aciditolerans]MBI6874808.1 DUF4132 domain-containing protein [Clostridium aciditolerans]
MDELLNLLKVNLCNCSLKDEEVQKIKEYIENGGALDYSNNYKYNISPRGGQYKIQEKLWELMDSFMNDKDIFKRLLNVFFIIGEDSFFKMLYSRFYSISKILDYLKYMDNKERFLLWIIKDNSSYSFYSDYVREIITVSEELIREDKLILSKAFLLSEDDFIKVVFAIIAVKNSCDLPEDGESFVKAYLGDINNINKYLKDKQIALVKFLYYAHSESEEFVHIVTNIVNNSHNKRNIFDEWIRFINAYDSKANAYDIANAFDIDKRLYVIRLINLYIKDENKKVLKEINERIKEIPLVFRETLDFINKSNLEDVERLTLASFIYNHSREDEDLKKLNQYIGQVLSGYIYFCRDSAEVSLLEKTKALQYVLEGKNKDCINEYTAKAGNVEGAGRLWSFHALCFKLIYSINETREIMYRFLEFVLKAERYSLSSSIIDKIIENQSMSYISFAKELTNKDISEKHLILTADRALNEYNFRSQSKVIEYLGKLCLEENIELINNIEILNINVKEIVLEKLFNVNNEKYAPILIKYLSDNSKIIRDKMVTLLSSYEGCKKEVLSELKSKKLAVREAVARILTNFDMRDSVKELQKFADSEKNEKVKVLLLNIINADYLDNEILETAESISRYCTERLKKTAYTAPEWIPVSVFQDIRYEDGKVVSKDVINYLISKYSLENIVERNLTAEKVIKKCNKHDLDKLGNEILNLWINNGADTKQKWILGLVSAVGGFNVINELKVQIDIWSKNSRGAIACDAIKALALNGSDHCLIVIDTIARKFKHKQIKKAAEEAFVFAAQMLNLTEEELEDKIVPDLDFNKRGERVFEFGSRSFTVTLNLDFSLKIVDSNGKTIKTLPKPNKSDDELKAKEASDEFKNLKKQIKTVVSIQTLRLEMALSANRIWKKKDWENLFVENPIMHNFSLGLVWGVYAEGELKDTFRYMEDGTFNTKDEEEYELLEDSLIGLVHPLEMDEETLNTWIQQFEDYEIVQPLLQLDRKVYKVNEKEKEMKSVERFGGTKINGLSLVGKLTKMGWYRGSVQDGGGYYQFYKEDEKIGIGAELSFEWLSVGYENEETTIYELTFYRANTVERGSYVYDEIREENIIVPSKVPERFFSEILYDVDRALEAKIGFIANWKLNR